ncbi:hypothetical protein ONZ45_g15550 [Pleurotus djamor]|nr:hypothetical protein ONZ45_g15550 [Pleurotus djamor]
MLKCFFPRPSEARSSLYFAPIPRLTFIITGHPHCSLATILSAEVWIQDYQSLRDIYSASTPYREEQASRVLDIGQIVAQQKGTQSTNLGATHGFSALFMEGMDFSFSASGLASVAFAEDEKDRNSKCEFKIYGDWLSSKKTIPTIKVFKLIQDWPNLIGVPCTLALTPIAQFVDTSPEAKILYELERHKITSMGKA